MFCLFKSQFLQLWNLGPQISLVAVPNCYLLRLCSSIRSSVWLLLNLKFEFCHSFFKLYKHCIREHKFSGVFVTPFRFQFLISFRNKDNVVHSKRTGSSGTSRDVLNDNCSRSRRCYLRIIL